MEKVTNFFKLLIFALPWLTGCAYVSPYVQDLNFISVPQEIQISQQMQAQIAREMRLVTNSTANQRISAMGQRLVQALPNKQFNYQFRIVDDPTPNAFAIPGAAIYVHTGLLRFVSDDDMLAGVMAHEIGHAYERHSVKNLSRAYGVEYLSRLLFKENKSKLRGLTVQLAQGGLTKYSRDDERESDEVGFYLAKRAGYNPDGLKRFLVKLNQIQRSGGAPAFLSTHPPTVERIRRLELLEQGRLIHANQT